MVASIGPMTPLERFLVLQTQDVDEFRENMVRHLAPAKVVPFGGSGEVRTDLSWVALGPIAMIHARTTGSGLRVQLTDEIDYYDVNLAVSGLSLIHI